MNEIGIEAKKLAILMKPMVAMIVKEIRPKDDNISLNQAYKEFGRRWVDSQRREENFSERHHNGRVYLSRAELEALRAAEATKPQLILKADKEHGYESYRDGDTLVVRKVTLPSPQETAPKKRGRKPKMILNAGF